MPEQKYRRMDPYAALRNAIVEQAAADFRKDVAIIKDVSLELPDLRANKEKLEKEAETGLINADDLKKAEGKLDRAERKLHRAEAEIIDVERFFRSGWYRSICSVDGEWMISKLREEAKEIESKRIP